MELLIGLLLVAILLPALLPGQAARKSPYLVAIILLSAGAIITHKLVQSPFEPEIIAYSWSSSFGASFSFVFDGLSASMALLICFIGAGVFVYCESYIPTVIGSKTKGFYFSLTVFTVAMLGLVFSDNMIAFFLFWELTSLCSFLLIGTKHKEEFARESARKALLITASGGLFLLLAFILISAHMMAAGFSLEESLKFSNIDGSITGSSSFPWVLFCILIAIGTKSAQMPFHFWLPAAMAGPTPVSSFLHSATMVKAGIFLLARLSPAMAQSPLWFDCFTAVGAVTMIVSAFMAAAQRDIKKILAYSTITVLGILCVLIGLGTEYSVKAAVVFLFAHALYKAALFQIIGNIDFSTGSRDLKTLGDLGKAMPLTAIAACLATLSMAGAPPLFGFFGKELAYLAKVQLGTYGITLIVFAVLANILMVGLAVSIGFRPFWKKSSSMDSIKVQKIPLPMALVPFVFALAGLFIGLFPGAFDTYFGTAMASSIAGYPLPMNLKLWHGISLEALTVVGLSAFTLLGGLIVAVKIKPLILHLEKVKQLIRQFGPNSIYDKGLKNFLHYSNQLTLLLQNGSVHRYLSVILIGALALLCFPVVHALSQTRDWGKFQLFSGYSDLAAVMIISLPIAFGLQQSNSLHRLIWIGISGFGIVIAFLFFGAPDLALTQLLVECLTLIFVLFLIMQVKNISGNEPGQSGSSNIQKIEGEQRVNYLIAGLLAIAIAAMVSLNPTVLPLEASDYFQENSYSKAFGKNIVNVILVDFRALDTFGEIIVVALAALGTGLLLSQIRTDKTEGRQK